MKGTYSCKELAEKFKFGGELINSERHICGHINDTHILKFKQCYPELENGQEGKVNFIDCATKAINERNDLLESVFLCDFNKRACTFKDDKLIKLLSER